MGSEGLRGGDDFGEVGLERIGLHRVTQRDIDEVSASGSVSVKRWSPARWPRWP